ncbi:N-acetyltransferase ESCO1-like [Mizuhopecten yessoensis]|uniref:N-acetyltransferase ESCO1-like n=1 Tax=Mizuhopecten yessoensis TaxID=6573 RepID=UPI000B458070|nr:N-acetyltransferase ESCO1-like [Mizuhopecten yessoensis]
MVTINMATRTRKRRWQSSPDRKTARASLNFSQLENTPPRKRRAVLVDDSSSVTDDMSDTESSIPAEESFTTKSFYGGRQKKNFPHSPGRRKAAQKVRSKLSEDKSASEEDVLTFKSSNEDSSPQSDISMAVLRTRKTPNSTGKILKKTLTKDKNVKALTVKEMSEKSATPENGRKFFKHKSPASASKVIGSSVIIRKGFNLKFVPSRNSKSAGLIGKKKAKKPGKVSKSSKPHEVKSGERNVSETLINTETSTTDSACHSTMSDVSASEQESQKTIAQPEEVGASEDLFPDGSEVTEDSSPALDCSSLASSMTDLTSVESGPTLRNRGKNPVTGKTLFPIFTSSKNSPKSSPVLIQRNSHMRPSPRMSPRRRLRPDKDSQEQMILDAGQKKFGAIQCDVCSMVYTPEDPTDDTTHSKFHQSLLTALRFPGWKKERVVQEYPDLGSRIIMVLHDDPKYAIRKVEDINKIMGQELGFPEASLIFKYGYKVFLYISDDKTVEGCCVAEHVSQGYPVIGDSQPSQGSQPGHRPWCCQSEPQPASVGVSRIWVHCQHRQKGIASKLLDCVRQWFEYGVFIEKKQIAFSDPTPDGKQLATRYTGTPNFLVYKYG